MRRAGIWLAAAIAAGATGAAADEAAQAYAIARNGRAPWCAAMLNAFGPGGVLLPGLVGRAR